ncbi:hypothetical protein ABIA30_003693 [Mycobacterium sp. MAA66]|uniref:hypothetical protein n=1 Tax=Mycobacterium sp. MAA66 TaxID=3156297 RepID=UPI00351269C3
MTLHGRRNTKRMSRRYRLAAVAVGIGIAAAGHDVAWAETGHPDSGNSAGHTSAAASASPGPAKPVTHPGTTAPAPQKKGKKAAADTSQPPDTATPSAAGSDSPVPQHNSAKNSDAGAAKRAAKTKNPVAPTAATKAQTAVTTPRVSAQPPAPAHTPVAAAAVAATSTGAVSLKPTASSSSPTNTTTVPTPAPLSPIAQLIALPGRIINTVLQVLDLTVSQSGPKSPFNWSPIDEALFAAFRGFENVLGLNKTPANQPKVPTLTYTGPTNDQTPTVAQFLDAAAGAYVLGGQPGGLKPFTVNGFQMQTFNPLSGAVGKAWVTPQGQIVIAYQGTTGGTNLLFHPLIAITQFITDFQIIFTHTTPQAFYDSLAFERAVQAAATAQGYSTGDIYLTGHSLGGWEAQYVAQQTGLGGIGFEGPGLNTSVAGNGVNSNFVNIETYGDTAAYFSTDLPGLQPLMPAYVPGGGSKPHYGDIVMIGNPSAVNPLFNDAALLGLNPINDIVAVVDALGNFLEHHLPGMQAYNLGVAPDPGVVPWLGAKMGPINNWGGLTIGQLQQAASDAGVLIAP